MQQITYTNTKLGKKVPIYCGNGILSHLIDKLKELDFDKLIVFADSNVQRIYGHDFHGVLLDVPHQLIIAQPGEEAKSFENFQKMALEILSCGISSKTVMLIVGGGVVGNIGGLLATTLKRGIRFVHVPTTFLAQSDSCMGGKQGINTPFGKNTIGAISEPEFIFCDFELLKTLPQREVYNGISESIKHALIQDESLFEWFVGHLPENMSQDEMIEIAKKTMELKLHFLTEENQKNKSGTVMKIGHELAHVIESVSDGYLHGEAVAIGLGFAFYLANQKGYVDKEICENVFKTLAQWRLPLVWSNELSISDIVNQFQKEAGAGKQEQSIILMKQEWLFGKNGRITYVQDAYAFRQIEELLQDYYFYITHIYGK